MYSLWENLHLGFISLKPSAMQILKKKSDLSSGKAFEPNAIRTLDAKIVNSFCNPIKLTMKTVNFKSKSLILIGFINLLSILSVFSQSPPNLTLIECGSTKTFGTLDLFEIISGLIELGNSGDEFLTVYSAEISGPNAESFALSEPIFGVSAHGKTERVITCTASSYGILTATLTITSNSITNSVCVLNLSANVPAPEISVQNGLGDVVCPGIINFGSHPIGSSTTKTVTIKNASGAGQAILENLPLNIYGTDATQFNILSQPFGFLSGGASTIFSISFTPNHYGSMISEITIETNDDDLSTCTITLLGSVPSPEIEVLDGELNVISCNQEVYLDSTDMNDTVYNVFTIKNIGAVNLLIDSISLNNDSMFIISTPNTLVVPGGSTDFIIGYTPQTYLADVSTLTIFNNDYNESTCQYFLNGAALQQELKLSLNETTLDCGASIDFLDVLPGEIIQKAILVQNIGNDTLTFSPTTILSFDAPETFTLIYADLFELGPLEYDSIVVSYAPTEIGTDSAIINFASSDFDESLCMISLKGCSNKWYLDSDYDGFGDVDTFVISCSEPFPIGNYSLIPGDCENSNENIYPSSTEICDGFDNDCDGYIDEEIIIASILPPGLVSSCKGDDVTFESNYIEGYSYQWFKNGNIIPGAINATFATDKPAYYQVRVTSPEDCVDFSEISQLVMYLKPNANISAPLGSSLCSNVKLKVSYNPGYSYTWFLDDILLPDVTSNLLLVTEPGNYKCKVTSLEGCIRTTNEILVSACKLSGDTANLKNSILVFPNPANETLSIQFDTKQSGSVKIYLTDLTGKVVIFDTFSLGERMEQIKTINISNIPIGLYHLNLIGDEFEEVQLISIQR